MNAPLRFADIDWQADAVNAFEQSVSDHLPDGENGRN